MSIFLLCLWESCKREDIYGRTFSPENEDLLFNVIELCQREDMRAFRDKGEDLVQVYGVWIKTLTAYCLFEDQIRFHNAGQTGLSLTQDGLIC